MLPAVERDNPSNFSDVVARIGMPQPAVAAWFVARLEFF